MPDFGFENPEIENSFRNWIQINLSSYPHIIFRKNSHKKIRTSHSLITRKKKKNLRLRRISFFQRRTTQTRNDSHLINFLS